MKTAKTYEPEPRWPPFVALLGACGLYSALPGYMKVGPWWLVITSVLALMAPSIISHRTGRRAINRFLGFVLNGIVTAGMIFAIAMLISALPSHKEAPTQLLLSAGSLWITNILVFALWYWRLDSGGPYLREAGKGHADRAFLFPQMTLPPELKEQLDQSDWSPNFADYLFLAFNTSTAFSPTDVPVLRRWAKGLMMLQSLISLTVIALLAARAINIL